MRIPPSTFMAWPVMFRASSEARKAASLPMSSGVCSRFIGVIFSTARSNSARPDMSSPVVAERLREMACHISVHSNPGHIAFTVIPYGASWCALDWVQLTTAAFVVE